VYSYLPTTDLPNTDLPTTGFQQLSGLFNIKMYIILPYVIEGILKVVLYIIQANEDETV